MGWIEFEQALAIEHEISDIETVVPLTLQHLTKAGGYTNAPLIIDRMVETTVEHPALPVPTTTSHFIPPESSTDSAEHDLFGHKNFLEGGFKGLGP